MACLHCHVRKSCLPDLHQLCSVTTVFWTGSRRGVSELCNHQERSSLPTDFTGLLPSMPTWLPFRFWVLWLVMTGYDSLWLVTTMNELRTSCAVEVESFARKAPITETNLDRLERRIQSRAQGKAWESRSESRKVEKSFDKSASYMFVSFTKEFFKDNQRQLAQTVDGASTVSKAISGISKLGKLGSSGKVMPTCKARKGDVSDVNQSEFWLFHACSAFPNCSQSWHFSMFVSKQKTWCFATFSWTSTSEIGRIFTDFLVFFLIFVSLCPNCYGLVWFIEDPSRGSTLAWVKGARVPRQKRKSNTICQETTYTVPQIYMLFSFRLLSACVRGYS